MTGWFGQQWGAGGPAPVCGDLAERVDVPIGAPCLWCDELIDEGDSGVTMPFLGAGHNTHMGALHVECHLRQALGGVNHIEGKCLCCGGDADPDPPGLTLREAAIAAVAAFERKHGQAVLPVKRETENNVSPGGDTSGNSRSA